MKKAILLVAAIMVVGLAGCTNCGVPTYQAAPCAPAVQAAPPCAPVVQAAPPCVMAAKTDVFGNECGKPVYQGPHCIEMPKAVSGWFAAMHENIFNCQPDPVMIYQAPPACPPAAPKAVDPCDPCNPCR